MGVLGVQAGPTSAASVLGTGPGRGLFKDLRVIPRATVLPKVRLWPAWKDSTAYIQAHQPLPLLLSLAQGALARRDMLHPYPGSLTVLCRALPPKDERADKKADCQSANSGTKIAIEHQ